MKKTIVTMAVGIVIILAGILINFQMRSKDNSTIKAQLSEIPEDDGMLSVRVLPKYNPNGHDILLDFDLINSGQRPIRILNRSNSWGAYQWKIFIEEANGKIWKFVNPQQTWTKNVPDFLVINSGATFSMSCRVITGDAIGKDSGNENDIFVSIERGTITRYPVIITGVFESRPSMDTSFPLNINDPTFPNWEGIIRAKPIWIEK